MPSSADLPHRSQLLSPLNHRRLEYAMSLAVSQSAATVIWVGCDDADGDGKWEDRYNFFYSFLLPVSSHCCLWLSQEPQNGFSKWPTLELICVYCLQLVVIVSSQYFEPNSSAVSCRSH